jgi:hypothetical protein
VGRCETDLSAEDSAHDPFAGPSDSFLFVDRDRVIDRVIHRVIDCWASAFNAEAVAYRASKGLDPFTTRVPVGVQRMVTGTQSFVAFTRDPRDPRDRAERCAIAAACGTWGGVVLEKADVDYFFVDAASGAVTSAIDAKRRSVGWDARQLGSGPVPLPVDAADATAPVLTSPQVRAVVALAARLEEHFAAPQDIEGTITEDRRELRPPLNIEEPICARRDQAVQTRPGFPTRPGCTVWTDHANFEGRGMYKPKHRRCREFYKCPISRSYRPDRSTPGSPWRSPPTCLI